MDAEQEHEVELDGLLDFGPFHHQEFGVFQVNVRNAVLLLERLVLEHAVEVNRSKVMKERSQQGRARVRKEERNRFAFSFLLLTVSKS